jgi:hypothetical protein
VKSWPRRHRRSGAGSRLDAPATTPHTSPVR